MLVKRLLIAPLIVLTVWMAMAFVVVRHHNLTRKKDQLTLGTIGEPDTLNPIISQTTSASEVEGFVFNGLVKRNEKLEIVGDLAETYRVTQNSTAFFADAQQATQALNALNQSRNRWAKIGLSTCKQAGKTIVLHFDSAEKQVVAGTGYGEILFQIVDRSQLLPICVITVIHDPGQDITGVGKATGANIEKIAAEIANAAEGIDIHQTHHLTESLTSISITGDSATFRASLNSRLAGENAEKPAGEVFDFLDQALLNEPVITFKLRKQVRWHDGQPLTSADAAFTYASILDSKYRSPRSSSYWPVKRVETPDPHTFVVTYRFPYGECIESWAMSLIPKHILEGKSPQWWADNYNFNPIGTGPFKFSQWQRNEFLRLEANDDYFEGKPKLPAVIFRVLPDPFVNQVAFDARGFDTYTLAPYQVTRYKNDPKAFEVFQQWGQGYVHIGWNIKKPMFQDRRVRIALAHAIDVDQIRKYVYRGYAKASKGTFPEHMWYANKTLKPYPYDIKEASRLLAEAGWTDTDGDGWIDKDGKRFEFSLITNNGNTNRAAIQALVQDDLKKVGIKVNIAVYEWAVFIKNYIHTQQFDACVLGWYLGYSYDLFQLWHSSQIDPPGLNHCSYRNDEVDKLLLEIRTTFDHDRIAVLCSRLQEIIYRDQPYLFLVNAYGSSALYRNKYVVDRPDSKGGRILEPVRNTDAGYGIYMNWWAPASSAPHLVQ